MDAPDDWVWAKTRPAPRPARRHGPAAVSLAGLAGLLLVGMLVLATLVWPPVTAVGGTALPQAVAPAPPIAPPAAPGPAPPVPASTRLPVPAPATTPAAVPAQPAGQRPGTIRLPAGGTATLVRKEVGPGAVLPVPENLGEATWWGAGLDAPGGASVFAGHVNWNGRIGPFAELWADGVNQPVTVTDTSGTAWNYRVTQVFTLHKDELPGRADDLFGQQGAHRIVLVTCGGRWLGGSEGYAENRVVIAEPVR